MRAVVVTVSTRAAGGVYDDTAGPAVADVLAEAGFEVLDVVVVPDGRQQVAAAIVDAAGRADLVVTNGGTGLHPNDHTPEATLDVVDRLVPGVGEAMRAASLHSTPMAMLSRGIAGVRGGTLVVNVPGSPGGAVDSVRAITPVLSHAVEQLHGGDHVRSSAPAPGPSQPHGHG